MAYLQPFTSVTMNGTTAGGNEIWSAGFHLDSEDAPVTGAEWVDLIDEVGFAIAELLGTMYESANLQTPADTFMTSVKFANIGIDGKYLQEAVEFPLSAQGSLNSGYAPQVALVTTLQSSKFKDPGKYNRFYLPIAMGGVGGTWRLAGGNQTAYLDTVADTMDAINAELTAATTNNTVRVSVVSSSGTGFSSPAIALRLGQILDTQRRRRNKLPEAYATQGLITG